MRTEEETEADIREGWEWFERQRNKRLAFDHLMRAWITTSDETTWRWIGRSFAAGVVFGSLLMWWRL